MSNILTRNKNIQRNDPGVKYSTSCSLLLQLTNIPLCALFLSQWERSIIYTCSRNYLRAKYSYFNLFIHSVPMYVYWALLALRKSTLWAYYSHTGPIVYELYKTWARDPLKCCRLADQPALNSMRKGNMCLSTQCWDMCVSQGFSHAFSLLIYGMSPPTHNSTALHHSCPWTV